MDIQTEKAMYGFLQGRGQVRMVGRTGMFRGQVVVT